MGGRGSEAGFKITLQDRLILENLSEEYCHQTTVFLHLI